MTSELIFDSMKDSGVELARRIAKKHPLVHCIVPAVSASRVANLLTACSASPIMSDYPSESGQVTKRAQALALSLGMPSSHKTAAMQASAVHASNQKIPFVLDLTGIGVSDIRQSIANSLIYCHPAVIKGNLSELSFLCHAGGSGTIDADLENAEQALCDKELINSLKQYAIKKQTILVCTGKTDLLISQDGNLFTIYGGSEWMSRISGTGCMLNTLLAAALSTCGSEPDERIETTRQTLGLFKSWGEKAEKRMKPEDGCGSYWTYFLDAATWKD